MASPRVVLLDAGNLRTVILTSLFVATKVSGVWQTTKASTSLTLSGTNVVVVDAGWYRVEKNGAAPDLLNLSVSALVPLTGANGAVYNIIGPLT